MKGKALTGSLRGRKSTATEVTAQISTTSLLSGSFEPSVKFELTNLLAVKDEEDEEEASDTEESDDESVESADDGTFQRSRVYPKISFSRDKFSHRKILFLFPGFEEALKERRQVLEDARNLHMFAYFFLHPEKPVEVDATASARCYFVRASAPEQLSVEESEERAAIMEDLESLKKLAVDYLHPEIPVVTTDATACGRNYFSRYSAIEQEDIETVQERDQLLEEARALQKLAVDYMHPETPVVTSDPCACARNYFSRYSAPEQEDIEQEEERALVLQDALHLKELAVAYRHPELPVVTSDPCASGRNYFSRYSAPEQEDAEEAEERARILADAKALQQLAVDYLHPELPVTTTDAVVCGRNYFSRYSAPEQEEYEEAEERARVLADAKALQELAVAFLHPERPVTTTDPFACGRNYSSRYSSPEQEEYEEAEERARVLADAKALQQLAVDFAHPERPVVTTDPFACGRNFFSRFSAPEQEGPEDVAERARVLEESQQLLQLAVDYKHPELTVVTTDPTACGRNYFSRFSAPEQEDVEYTEDRARVLEEAQQLLQLAVDYKHPELPVVTTDSTACGRNYFSRASAPEQESAEYMEERALVLEEAKMLQKLAVDFLHPELPVVTTDTTACGRNYFTRASAAGQAAMVHTFPADEDHDAHHEEHHDYMEHWGMEEDDDLMFEDMRQHLVVPSPSGKMAAGGEEEEEGNLSRSPSTVMLFAGESIYD
jgi:hypothetical protein